MSYAEQMFGIKEAEAREYANDLAWFGESSYVYRTTSIMKKLLDSRGGIMNPVANEYIARWISDHAYDATRLIMNPDFRLGIYNSDLDRTIYFVPIKQLDDGTIVYITDKEYVPYMFAQNSTKSGVGSDLLEYKDFKSVVYLNSNHINWKSEYTRNDKIGQDDWSERSFSGCLAKRPGFLHGLATDTIANMKPVDPDVEDYICLPLIERYISEVASYASQNPDFFGLTKEAYSDYELFKNTYGTYDMSDTFLDTLKMRMLGESKPWVFVMKALSADATLTYPVYRGTITSSGENRYALTETVQASSDVSHSVNNGAPVSMMALNTGRYIMIRI